MGSKEKETLIIMKKLIALSVVMLVMVGCGTSKNPYWPLSHKLPDAGEKEKK
jgi:hypothetical protein